MSIYFNFNESKLEFVLQQNNNKYFAVNFLNAHNGTIDFEAIIDEVVGKNSDLLSKLTFSKHIVVLPSFIVGYGTISVPKSLFYTGRDFETKFNTLYNRVGNMSYEKFKLSSKDNVATFAFTTYRQDLLQSIESAFKKYNIKIAGFTTYARAVNKYAISKLPELSSSNFLAVFGGDILSISGNISSKVLSSLDKKLLESNLLAKEFVKSIMDNGVSYSQDNNPHNDAITLSNDEKALFYLRDYENCYKNDIKFDKIVNFTSNKIDDSIVLFASNQDILGQVDKSILLNKKGFFSL